MAKKIIIELSVDDEVPAGNTEVSTHAGAVPSGKVARIKNFGGATPLDSDGVESLTVLQWGSGGTWKTVRGFTRSTINMKLDLEFVGDGSKTFRLIRSNLSSTDKKMLAWLEGLIITP